jgi:succinate dehydrogenase / fumarate reductase flavoprotein subunit
MQGLADGYFVIPYTLGNYLATAHKGDVDPGHPAFEEAESAARQRTADLLELGGRTPIADLHRQLGKVMWDHCGMERDAAGLEKALQLIPELRERFWKEAAVPGSGDELNPWLEYAGRVADFMEFAEIMCLDALERDESCGGHFRVEHQSAEGEAVRRDDAFTHASVWEYKGEAVPPQLHREHLEFENVKLSTRSYK